MSSCYALDAEGKVREFPNYHSRKKFLAADAVRQPLTPREAADILSEAEAAATPPSEGVITVSLTRDQVNALRQAARLAFEEKREEERNSWTADVVREEARTLLALHNKLAVAIGRRPYKPTEGCPS
jgi:hypothetical protein